MAAHRPRRRRVRGPLTVLLVAGIGLLASVFAAPLALSQDDTGAAAPVAVEIADDGGSFFERVADALVDFQRRANAEVALHMNAIQRGEDFGAFLLALAPSWHFSAASTPYRLDSKRPFF